jgi:hypothetical protein
MNSSLPKLLRWGGLSLLLVGIAYAVFVWSGIGQSARVVRRISATACFQQGLPGIRAEMRLGNFNPVETEGIGPRTATNSITLYCPIPSDSLLPHEDIDLVVVHGWGSSLCNGPSNCPPFVLAYICVSYESAADGECTRFHRSEVRGRDYAISFSGEADLAPWQDNPSGYPYVRVDLPPPSFNGDTNTLRGITISGSSINR